MSVFYDKDTEDFKHQLPCTTCKFVGICKHAYSIEPLKLPENFSIIITCSEQEKLMKPQRKGEL